MGGGVDLVTESPESRATPLDPGGPNSIAVSIGIVGDEWTLWIVEMALQQGFTQYNEWLRAGPISSSVLTARLARLVDAGVFKRTPYNSRPPRNDYHLTTRGRQLWPILISMWAWEETWVDDPQNRLPQMRHSDCGRVFTPVQVCAACDAPATIHDVRAAFGASGSWPRSIPSASTRRRSHSGTRPPELVEQTMALIGNRWSTAMIGAAFMGARRFGEFEAWMGAPPTIVAERLRTFCEIGVLTQSPNPTRPDWSIYALTEKGESFYPVTALVLDWGERWFESPEGQALLMTHLACGNAFHPRLQCSACRQRLRGHAVEVVRAGDAPADDRGPNGRLRRGLQGPRKRRTAVTG